MSGASGTDRTVWQEFYDLQSSTLLTDTLRDEFARLWGATGSEDHTGPPQANAVAVMIEDEALRRRRVPACKHGVKRTLMQRRPGCSTHPDTEAVHPLVVTDLDDDSALLAKCCDVIEQLANPRQNHAAD